MNNEKGYIPPSDKHPLGGYKVSHTVKKKGRYFKSEKTVWGDNLPNKTALKLAAVTAKAECIEEAKAKAERAQDEAKEAEKRAERNVWTLERVALDRIEKYGSAGMSVHFRQVIELAGKTLPEDYEDAFWNTMKHLKETPIKNKKRPVYRKPATLNRYRSTFSMIFNHAFQVGAIDADNVLTRNFDYGFEPEDGRDRVWSPEEKERLFSAIKELNSWLYWPVYFASINPIRAGDLFGCLKDGNPGLRKKDWKAEDNWVEFLASKTGRRKRKRKDCKKRPTFLKQIDESLRQYFDSLPRNCDFLFPKISKDGFCMPINELNEGYRNEWERVCEKAKVFDFHFHDLKHCAITYLLDNGYTERDLKQCGIQYSQTMIDRYYHYHAAKAPTIKGFERPELKIYEKEA